MKSQHQIKKKSISITYLKKKKIIKLINNFTIKNYNTKNVIANYIDKNIAKNYNTKNIIAYNTKNTITNYNTKITPQYF